MSLWAGPEPADCAFLDGDHALMLAREPQDEVGVEGLCKPRIGHRRRQAEARQLVCRLQTLAKTRAVAKQRDLVAFAQDAAAADFQRVRFARHRYAEALAARLAKLRTAIGDRNLGRQHLDD